MPPIKLWLDDTRKPPEEGWHWVRTAEEAVAWLRDDVVTVASLDHDLDLPNLGGDPKTGYDVACWLEKHPEHYPPGGVQVHSMNPEGAKRMRAALANAATFYEREEDEETAKPPKTGKVTATKAQRIKVLDTPARRVDPQEVAKALGAECIGKAPKDSHLFPPPRVMKRGRNP